MILRDRNNKIIGTIKKRRTGKYIKRPFSTTPNNYSLVYDAETRELGFFCPEIVADVFLKSGISDTERRLIDERIEGEFFSNIQEEEFFSSINSFHVKDYDKYFKDVDE